MNKEKEFEDFCRFSLRQSASNYQATVAGSVAELPLEYVITNVTDIDLMQIETDYLAVFSTSEIPIEFRETVYVIETTYVHPGFARLRIYLPHACTLYESSSVGKRFLTTDELISESWEVNGPARTSPIFTPEQVEKFLPEKGIYCSKKRNVPGFHTDLVTCIQCKSWPKASAEWITRKRLGDWPSQMDIEKVVNEGCHLVPKPHLFNRSDKTMFRFSFSQAEIILIHTWSPIQKYIYHILRLIKTKIVQHCEAIGRKTQLCTYYFKTLMLWACENRQPEFWEESRMAISIGELLCEMIEWLIEKKCPNYFIPDNNMIGHFPSYMCFDVEIVMLLNIRERCIAEYVANVPMARKDKILSFKLSRKLLSLGQMSFSGQVIFFNRWRCQSTKKNLYATLSDNKFFLSEFSELYDAIEAHLQLANLRLNGVLCCDCVEYKRASKCFEKAIRNDDSSFIEIDLVLGDNVEDNAEKMFFKQREHTSSSGNLLGYSLKTDIDKQCKDFQENSQLGTNAAEVQSTGVPPTEESRYFYFKHLLPLMIDKVFPKATYFLCVAYSANFYYALMHDCTRALCLCDEAEQCFTSLDTIFAARTTYELYGSVVLTSKFMPLFDSYIQIVFGFLLLQRKIYEAMKYSVPNGANRPLERKIHEYAVGLSPIEFILYLKFRCLNRICINVPRCKILKIAALMLPQSTNKI